MLSVPSDEFYISEKKRPNVHNDLLWALDINDISPELKFRKQSRTQSALEFFAFHIKESDVGN